MNFSFKKSIALVLAVVLAVSGLDSGRIFAEAKTAKAVEIKDSKRMKAAQKTKKSAYEGTATLRIFSTTDLHGQSVRYSYDTASEHLGSLAQLSTVMRREKTLENGNYLTVDSGDTIYGLMASLQKNNRISGTQYMYKIMMSMGYDAVTMGNHDFDYGYPYLKKALTETGLLKKTVLCNVSEAKSGKKIWDSSKIIKKTVVTDQGEQETVKIGITGAVTPDLGTFSDWKEDVKTEEILDSVRAEVKKLKKSGADIVIVLSHSGIGDYHYPTEENAANVSYRVALIDGVDMVCAGHTHVDFPSKTSKAANTFDYPQTDENGLVNGTILVQEEDHAASLGISDIKFAFKNGKAIVKSKKARVYRIQDSDEEDTEVLKINKFYDEQAKEIYDRALLESEETRNNYFGMLEDNALIQITNEAKIAYGKKIVKEKKQEYMGYPVISSTAYELTGQNGSDDYIKTSGSVTLRDLLNVQMWGQKYAKVYYMTGAQLRECIEWSAASAFATQPYAGSSVWQDEEYNQYADIGFSPVLSPEWEDWTGFTVFDGVEYTIDVTKPPRYDRSGFHIINDSHRIKSLTCNGEAVQDDDIFIWVGYMTTNTWPPVKKQIVKQAVLGKQEPVSDIVTAYISEQSEKGSIILECDNNWRVEFPEAENYLLKSSAASKIVAVAKDWYVDCLKELNGYAYYQARLSASYEDTAGPLLVLAQIDSDASGDEVRIAVQTSDSSNISFIKYAEGSLAADDSAWNDANSVEGGILKVDKNGVYSVMAVDTCGNRTVKIITITNIDKTLATTPEVKQCKNTSAKVVGTASPKGKVYVEAKSGIYETEAEDDGSFSCAVVHLKSDEVIRVWQIDTLGRISEKKEVTVKRSGANAPDVDKINNKKSSITGVLEDSVYCKVVAIRGSSVYIPKGQKEAYKETKIYKNNEEKNIVETEFELDHFTKRFRLAVPKLYSNQKIKVYSYDWLCRSSTLTNIIVEDVAPNQPRLSKVIAQEGCVYGYIPNPQKDISYLVTAKCDGEEYEGKTDENGFFAISMGVLDVKKSVKVMASDTGKNGETRESLSASTQTIDFNDLEDVDFSNGYIEPLTNKTTVVTGYVNKLPANGLYLVYGGVRHLLSVDENGDFRYVLTRTRKAGSRVGLLSRNIDGSWQTFRYTTVRLAKPDKPVFLSKKIKETTTVIKVAGVDKAKGFLKIGSVKYKASAVKKKGKKYVYIFKVSNLKKRSAVRAWLTNRAGSSRKASGGIVHTNPKKDKKDKKNKNKNKKH